MAHVFGDKKKITSRIRRIRGQLDAVERGLEKEDECFSVLQTLAACRGALNGLMGEVIEGHVIHHIMKKPNNPTSPQDKAAIGLIELLKTYWK